MWIGPPRLGWARFIAANKSNLVGCLNQKKTMIKLRPLQQKAVDDLRQAYANGARAPILVAPTGFGKTATATEIVRLTIARGRSVWFLAHLREILDDTASRLTAASINYGSIRAGQSPNYLKQVQVVAVQTAVRR
jgi:superfamily II DNA or RNA helicase